MSSGSLPERVGLARYADGDRGRADDPGAPGQARQRPDVASVPLPLAQQRHVLPRRERPTIRVRLVGTRRPPAGRRPAGPRRVHARSSRCVPRPAGRCVGRSLRPATDVVDHADVRCLGDGGDGSARGLRPDRPRVGPRADAARRLRGGDRFAGQGIVDPGARRPRAAVRGDRAERDRHDAVADHRPGVGQARRRPVRLRRRLLVPGRAAVARRGVPAATAGATARGGARTSIGARRDAHGGPPRARRHPPAHAVRVVADGELHDQSGGDGHDPGARQGGSRSNGRRRGDPLRARWASAWRSPRSS